MVRSATLFAIVAASACRSGSDDPPPAQKSSPPAPAALRPAPVPRAPDSDALEYTLRLPEAAQHLIDVELVVKEPGETLTLALPVWTPGSYLIRDYSRHIEGFSATAKSGEPLEVEKVAKNRWRVAAPEGGPVAIRYRVYGRELTVRSNFVDSDFAIINGAATFLSPESQTRAPHDLKIELPAGWEASATSLRHHPDDAANHYVATDFDELVDSPIVLGNPTIRTFAIQDVPHTLALFGDLEEWDVERSAADVARISRTIAEFWGDIPYDRYVFLNVVAGVRNGLEHLHSTLMTIPPGTTRDDKSYRGWLGLVSHEFFHTWNGKRLRPDALGPFDYGAENYTPSLWIVEGLTSYYDDLLLRRAGLLDRQQYLEALSGQIETLQTTPGRLTQTLSAASFDAWIKHYRPDENSANTAISYYVKGAVAGFLLDAEIRRRTRGQKSLDDAMRLAYSRHAGDRGYTPEDFRAVVEEIIGTELGPQFRALLESTEEVDYGSTLRFYGLEFAPREPPDEDDLPVAAHFGALASDSM